jgi:hypothetical protein
VETIIRVRETAFISSMPMVGDSDGRHDHPTKPRRPQGTSVRALFLGPFAGHAADAFDDTPRISFARGPPACVLVPMTW